MGINYPTLAHFRHFKSLFTNLPSFSYLLYSVSYYTVFPIHPFMQNKANFPHFSPENDDLRKNKANSKPIQTQFNPIKANPKPALSGVEWANLSKRAKLIQSFHIQGLIKKKRLWAKKTNSTCSELAEPIKANNQSLLITYHLEGKHNSNPMS